MRRIVSSLILTAASIVAGGAVGLAEDVVEIRLRGHYFAEPATIRVVVAVAPDPEHRRLRIEADGDTMFRASEVPLSGDKRLHTIELKNLAAGSYILRAEVMSPDGVVGIAEQRLQVAGH